ncbi:MAG: hypothetical protein ACR2MK_06845 [Solirubrobacteraceae bacterium]
MPISQELGLPPAEIHEALTAVAATSAEQRAERDHPQSQPDHPQAEPEPPPREPEPPPPRRRRVWMPVGVVLALLVILLIVAVASGGGSRRRAVTHAASAPATVPAAAPAAAAPSTATSSSSSSPTVSARPTQALGALPDGLAHARGSIMLIGGRAHPALELSVTGLPKPRRGHYEVWLYNSILDSRPLARLRPGLRRLHLALPQGAHHYRWIDISLQPVGYVNHSGESVLRAANPAAGRRRG